MNRIDLYKKTVDILYQAYFNDTLEHGNSCACAIGNLVAANTGRRIITDDDGLLTWYSNKKGMHHAYWPDVHLMSSGPNLKFYRGDAKKEIDATGYTPYETCAIELAFESVDYNESGDKAMFDGLVAVLNKLKQIHEITDESLLQANHTRFSDHHNRLTNATHRTVSDK